MDKMDNTTEKVDMLVDHIDKQCFKIGKIVERISSFANAVDEFLKSSAAYSLKTADKFKTPR